MNCCKGEGDGEFKKGDPKRDFTGGPMARSGCTDPLCVLLFIASWVLFVIVTVAGMANGNPAKLYSPRDYSGAYCGVTTNWNNGPDLSGHGKQIYMMNTTSVVDLVAMELVCTSSVRNNVLKGALTTQEYQDLMCGCCLVPCKACTTTHKLNTGASTTDVASRMTELTATGGADMLKLFSGSGANGDLFSDIFSSFTKNFVEVCVKDELECKVPDSRPREYTYSPPKDALWKAAWDKLKDGSPGNNNYWTSAKSTINDKFKFKALSAADCPYDPQYCVPFPGTTFSETVPNYCTLELNSAVTDALGGAASAIVNVGLGDISSHMESNFGSMTGDILKTIDALILTMVIAFVIGLVFLILLRFFVGTMVWGALLCVWFILLISGFLAWIRSFQCKGVGIFATGTQVGAGAVSAAASSVDGTDTSKEACSKADCSDYQGMQTRTETGRSCAKWIGNSNPYTNNNLNENNWSPHKEGSITWNEYETGKTTDASATQLKGNYCRNPSNTDGASWSYIWCYTTDTGKVWEACLPIGVIKGDCKQGLAVESETMRTVLVVLAVIGWVLAGLWLLMMCCMCKQINLAIKLNKVGAEFVGRTRSVLLIPMSQVLIGLLWCGIWAFFFSFLISQVPDGYTPTTTYATYAEAYGTYDTPGKCTDKYPNGGLYRTNDGWKCKPPRYILYDPRIVISLFHFLWVNAFNIACGQCMIAGAAAVWFFTKREEKGVKPAVRTGVKNALLHHTGSLAFGAFIIAVVQLIRLILYYFQKQAEAQKNRAMACLLKICQCCMWCLEKCLKFLNKNAYIQIALLGSNFCTAAKDAFWLIFNNAARFGILAMLGEIIEKIGFLFIMAGSMVCGYFVLKGLHPETLPVIPMIMFAFVSYLVARLYMNVFGLAVDTMLQCFIATEKMGGDTGGFVPTPLKSLVANLESKDDGKDAKSEVADRKEETKD